MTTHVDGDVLVYAAGFAGQKTRYYLDGQFYQDYEKLKVHCALEEIGLKQARADGRVESEVELFPERVAINAAKSKLVGVLDAVGSGDDWQVYFSGPTNYRDEIAVTKKYKGNRDGREKPHHYSVVKNYLTTGPLTKGRVHISDNCEADDLIGIASCADENSIICTIDKDLNCLPGKHYDWYKGIRYVVSPHLALWFFLFQLVVGDSTDNIPGIPRHGDKKAQGLLENYREKGLQEAWDSVQLLYKDKGEDYLVEQGRLLWIQRKANQLWDIGMMNQEIVYAD